MEISGRERGEIVEAKERTSHFLSITERELHTLAWRWKWEANSVGESLSSNIPWCNSSTVPYKAGPPRTMIWLFKKCCGLRALQAVQKPYESTRCFVKPQMIFLGEMHLSTRCMERVNEQLGFWQKYVVPSSRDKGLSGGLAFFWSKEATTSLDSFSNYHIDLEVV